MAELVTDGRRGTVGPLLKAIVSAWEVAPDGSLKSRSLMIGQLEEAIIPLLNFSGSRLSAFDFESCVREALREVSRSRNPSIDALELAYSKSSLKIKKRPSKVYYASSRCFFRARGNYDLWVPLNFWDIRAIITGKDPAFFNGDDFFLNGYGGVNPSAPDWGALLFLGPLRARSATEALEIASRDIAVVLGLIAFYQNAGTITRYIGHERPLTPMISGKETILYDHQWNRIEENIAYHPTVPDSVRDISKLELDRLINIHDFYNQFELDKTRVKFAKHFLKLYYYAVSELRSEDQLIRLWKAAEYVTCAQGGKTAQISKRLSLCWRDREAVYALSESVGHRRNEILHNENDGLPIGSMTYMFREIVERCFIKAMAKGIPNLNAWKTALEFAAGTMTDKQLAEAIPTLKGFGWSLP